MNLLKILNFIHKSESQHFISVDKKTYSRWKFLLRVFLLINKNYKPCEIFRKRYKSMDEFVVIGLKYSGKNVRRRTSGFAKEFLSYNGKTNCIYCETQLNNDNATADHIIPISQGGNNSQVNLVVCCKYCNNERGSMNFKEYLKLKRPSHQIKFF